MAAEQLAKSDEQQVDIKDLKKVEVKNLSKTEAADLADEILKDPNNEDQVKVFPDLWNSLNEQQKSDFVSKLE
jgi:hypothetical protein